MQHPDYDSPSALSAFMQEQAIAMQKKFGQNFMISRPSRQKIVAALGAGAQDQVWEVGPGLGCMTELLLGTGATVTAFEIDRAFSQLLPQFFAPQVERGQLAVVAGDVLKTWKKQAECLGAERQGQAMLFGNLPYNIAATFIADTITGGVPFKKCVFTVQKEVAERMAARPSGKNYSAFSVLCQWAYTVRLFVELPPAAFWPRPTVASSAVLMERREDWSGFAMDGRQKAFFVRMVHALFLSRRKTVQNNLRAFLRPGVDALAVLDAARIQPSERAENLTIAQFLQLSQQAFSATMVADEQ